MIHVRWRVILQPWCLIRGHDEYRVETVPMGWDYFVCHRCGRRES